MTTTEIKEAQNGAQKKFELPKGKIVKQPDFTQQEQADKSDADKVLEGLNNHPNLYNPENEKLYKTKVDEIHSLEDELMVSQKENMTRKDKGSKEKGDAKYDEIRGKQHKIGEELLKSLGITLQPGQRVDVYAHITGDMQNKGEKSISIILANGPSNYENSTRYMLDPTQKIFKIED